MLKIDIITLFPNSLRSPLAESILGKAFKRGIASVEMHDIRDYTTDKHRQADDYPFGGGSGMVMKAEPIFRCVESLLGLDTEIDGNSHIRDRINKKTAVVLLSPQGRSFTQKTAVAFSLLDRLILICGHYKGIDERVNERLVTHEISIGDYVLTGGEPAALIIIDAVVRLLPGAMSDANSALGDSFQEGILDCPYYTRPETFRGMPVPGVLLSGDHKRVEEWRHEKRLQKTKSNRPDLLEIHDS